MELKEAIERIKELQDSLILNFAEEKELSEAIDTVLEELNNRIPKENIENLIKDIDRELEILDKKQDDSIIYSPRDICNAEKIRLEELLNKEEI